MKNFLSKGEIDKVINVFNSKFINEPNTIRLNLNKTTVGIASSYNHDNRVYKNWGSTINSDFCLFSLKKGYDFGLLISNYKTSDQGIKLVLQELKFLNPVIQFTRINKL